MDRVALPFCSLTLTTKKPSKFAQNPKTLGDHIKRRRLELGLYQAQLAPILGITESTITNWEKNRTNPTLHLLPKIIEFLGYDPLPPGTTSLGEILLRYRKTRGVSQKEMAKSLGIDPTTLARWEKSESEPKGKVKIRLSGLLAETSSMCK
jgi:transcriptional regulator with XRE-family HTH domain